MFGTCETEIEWLIIADVGRLHGITLFAMKCYSGNFAYVSNDRKNEYTVLFKEIEVLKT